MVIQAGCGARPEAAEEERAAGQLAPEEMAEPGEGPAEVVAEGPAAVAQQAASEKRPATPAAIPEPGAAQAPAPAAQEPEAPAPSPEPAEAAVAAAVVPAAAAAVDWVGAAQKWVPIFSLEREGVYLGAAQIAGPTAQVEKVKGVAELRLQFKDIGRIYTYVPVSTISLTKLKRVQGVSVWAIGDVKLAEF